MKDSGIEWIGTIPDTWKVQRFKNVMHKDKKICEHYQGQDIISLTMNGVIIRDLENPSGKMPTTWDGYQFVEPEDLLLCLFDIDVTPRCVGLVKDAGLTSPAYSRFKVHKGYYNAYYDYLLRWIDDEKIFIHLSKNLRSSLSEDDFGAIHTIVPPLAEQQKIAAFLDKQCSEIDAVLTKTKESIEEYKLLKNAIITQAVTKGIRPNRKMKDSGIEWIGEIPEEWNIEPLTNRFSFGKGLPITKENLVEKGIPVISYGQIHGKYNPGTSLVEQLFRYVSEEYLNSNPQCLVHKNDLIVADTSEDLDGCGNAAYIDKEMKLFAGYHTVILFAKNKESNKYFSYLLKTDAWRSQIRAGLIEVKLYSVSRKVLKKTNLLIPSQKEQTEIVEYLDKKCNQIDTLITKKEQLITELETYKKSLIYEYVTGKKEVQ